MPRARHSAACRMTTPRGPVGGSSLDDEGRAHAQLGVGLGSLFDQALHRVGASWEFEGHGGSDALSKGRDDALLGATLVEDPGFVLTRTVVDRLEGDPRTRHGCRNIHEDVVTHPQLDGGRGRRRREGCRRRLMAVIVLPSRGWGGACRRGGGVVVVVVVVTGAPGEDNANKHDGKEDASHGASSPSSTRWATARICVRSFIAVFWTKAKDSASVMPWRSMRMPLAR